MKLLVNVYVPAIAAHYDILIPANLRIRNIANMIATTVEELSDHLYVASGEECLCSVDKQILFRQNATLEDYGVQNGSQLVMM